MFFNKYKKLKWLAYHDSLTGLLNRNWLYENMHTITQRYVYFIDINNLKEINKKGHTFGDEHIKYVIDDITYRIKCAYSDWINDVFIRYAGDEFILFTNGVYLETCDLYSVGYSENLIGVKNAIITADSNMIINKENFKKQ